MERIVHISKACKEFFNQKAEMISLETGFIKRKRKLTGPSFIKSIILSHIQDHNCSINAMCQWLSEDCIKISKQGLDFRFSIDAVRFMQAMYLAALTLFKNSLQLECKILQQFQSVKLIDSSYITLPNNMENIYKGCAASYNKGHESNTKSAIKLQLIFDYLNQTIEGLEITAGIRADAGYRVHLNHISSNDLLIADLGYFVPSSFKKISESKAYFISRYKSDTNLYETESKRKLELIDILNNKLSWEQEVILGKESQLKVRIICEKLTPEQSEARRRKANRLAKSHGYKSSAKNQKLLDWSIFITNIPENKVSGKQVLKIYRIRWQVELLFKLYKSQMEIDNFHGNKPSRVLCELYAKLCIVVIFHGLANCIKLKEGAEISLTKAYIYLKKWIREFFIVLRQSVRKIQTYLGKIACGWSRFLLKDPSYKKRISTLQTLKTLSQIA